MDRIVQENIQLKRLISEEDERLVLELRVQHKTMRDRLKGLERDLETPPEIIDLLRFEIDKMRRAAYRLEQLAQWDHLKKVRGLAA